MTAAIGRLVEVKLAEVETPAREMKATGECMRRNAAINAEFAARSRERLRPAECDSGAVCWVAIGGRDALAQNTGKADRCAGCWGKLNSRNWRPPSAPPGP